MRINYNVSAMIANNSLFNSENSLAASLERLSSGLKINSAKDNPAGLAMAQRMNAQIEGLSVATDNTKTGINVIETADGAMEEIHSMLQRMNEIAVKAETGTWTDDDREIMDSELHQIKLEIQRIVDDTQFNGQQLLDGTFDLKAYTTENAIKVSSCSDGVDSKIYTIDSITVTQVDGVNTVDLLTGVTLGDGFPADAKVSSCVNGVVTITASGGFEMKIDVSGATDGTTYTDMDIDATGIGAMRMQIGANEGQIIGMVIPDISLDKLGIKTMSVLTADSAGEANQLISDAMKIVSNVRSKLGAYQNRLESTVKSNDVTSENMTESYSLIMDVDMALEMTNYSTLQVLTQAGTAMVAQANERPSQVLQLLQ